MPLEICDFHNGRRWVRLTIADALARTRRGKMMRCPECHGQVVPFRAYKTGARAHFEHRHAHYGCSFSEALNGASESERARWSLGESVTLRGLDQPTRLASPVEPAQA